MRMTWLRGAGFFGFLAIAAACSSSSDNGSTGGACTPGDSKSCTGTGGCAGAQVCNADGTAYGSCDCGSADGGGGDSGSNDSGSTDSGVDAGWSPTDLSGLRLWTEASMVSLDGGNAVGGWPDQSGHGQNMSGDGTQTFVAGSTISGGPAIRMSSTSSSALSVTLSDLTTTDYVLEAVVNFDGTAASIGFGGLASGGGGFSLEESGDQMDFTSNSGTHATVTTHATHVIGVQNTGGTLSLRVDGTQMIPTASSATSGGGKIFYGPVGGDTAELVLVESPSATDLTNLETYLKSKYGL